MKITKRKRALSFHRYPQDQLQRLYRFIQEYQNRNHYLPSQDEMAQRFKTSRAMIQYWFKLMDEKKMVQRVPGSRRVFKLLPLQETQPNQEAS